MGKLSVAQLGEIDRFQESNKKVMLVTSEDSETVSEELESHLKKEPSQSELIFLNLAQLTNPFGNLLEEGLNENQLKELREGRTKFLFVLRNYEKCVGSKLENIYLKNRLERFRYIKIIFFCGNNFIKNKSNYKIFFASYFNKKCQTDLFQEICVDSEKIIDKHHEKKMVGGNYWRNLMIKKDVPVNASILEKHPVNQELLVNLSLEIKYRAQEILGTSANEEGSNIFLWKQLLFLFLKLSKSHYSLRIGAANAITILNEAKVSFSEMDLSQVCIPKANLENGVFYRTNFSGAILTDINFTQSIIEKVDFSEATLKGVELGEHPHFLGEEKEGYFLSTCFDVKGQLLAAGTDQGSIYIWDFKSGDQLHSIKIDKKRHTGAGEVRNKKVITLAFKPDSKFIACGCADFDNKVYLCDLKSGKMKFILDGHSAGIDSITYSSDGGLLASGSCDGMIRVTSTIDNSLICAFSEHVSCINGIAFGSDGRFLLSASGDGTIRIWEMSSKKTIYSFQDNSSKGIVSMALSPKNDLFAVVQDNAIILRNLDSKKILNVFSKITKDKHWGLILGIHFSPDQQLLISATTTGQVYIWDVENKELSYKLREESFMCTGICFYPKLTEMGEYLIAMGIYNGVVKILRAEKKIKINKTTSSGYHSSEIKSISYNNEKKLLLSSATNEIILWGVQDSLITKKIFIDNIGIITCASLNPDGTIVTIAITDEFEIFFIYTFNIKTNKLEKMVSSEDFRFKKDSIENLAFNNSGKLLFSRTNGGIIYVWDTDNYKLINTLHKNQNFRCDVFLLHPHESLLFSTSKNDIYVWDISDSSNIKQVSSFKGHAGKISALAVNPKGTVLVSGGLDKIIKAWSINNNICLGSINADSDILNLSFSLDEKWFLSSNTHEVYVWNTKTLENIFSVRGHELGMSHLRFVNDCFFITGSRDHAIRLFKLNNGSKKLNISLEWISHPVGLSLGNANITESRGLSQKNRKLLEQYMAIDEEASDRQRAEDLLLAHSAWLHRSPKKNSKNDNSIKYDLSWPYQIPSIEIVHHENVVSMNFSYDGMFLTVGTRDEAVLPNMLENESSPGSVCIYNLETEKLVQLPKSHYMGGIYAVSFNLERTLLAAGSMDGNVFLWDISNNKLLHTLNGCINEENLRRNCFLIENVAFHPNRPWLASACSDQTFKIWDIQHTDCISIFQKSIIGLMNIVFNTDGKYLAASSKNSIIVFNTNNFQEEYCLTHISKDPVRSIAFHPNSKWIASGPGNVNRNEKSISLWDIEKEEIIKKFKGPTHIVRSIAFHASGKFMAATSLNKVIYLWNMDNEMPLHIFNWNDAHTQEIRILFHPTEGYLAALGKYNILRRWDINFDDTSSERNIISQNSDNESFSTSSEKVDTIQFENLSLSEKIIFLKEKLADNSDNVAIYSELANLYLMAEDLENASEHYELAIALGSDFVGDFHNLACCYQLKNKMELAEGYFLRAISLGENITGVLVEYGLFLINNMRIEEAIQQLKNSFDTEYDDGFLNYGNLEKVLLDDYLQKHILEKGKIIIDYHTMAFYLLIHCYYNQQMLEAFKKSLAEFEVFINQTKDVIGYQLLSYIFHYLGEVDQAQEYEARALSLEEPKDISESTQESDNDNTPFSSIEDEISSLSDEIEKNPKNAKLYAKLGDIYCMSGNIKKGIENYRCAAAIDPKSYQDIFKYYNAEKPDDDNNLLVAIEIPKGKKSNFFENKKNMDEILFEKVDKILSNERHKFNPFLDAINEKDYNKALRRACTSTDEKSLELVKILIQFRDDPVYQLPVDISEQAGDKKLSALHHAALKNNIEMYHFLVTHGANESLKDVNNRSSKEYLQEHKFRNKFYNQSDVIRLQGFFREYLVRKNQKCEKLQEDLNFLQVVNEALKQNKI